LGNLHCPICHAAYENDFEEIYKALRESNDVNVQDAKYGDTAIIAACRGGNNEMIEFLLTKNADVNFRNKKGRTCLHYAVRKKFSFLDYLLIVILMPILLLGYIIMESKKKQHESLIRLLLEAGANVNAVDNKGNTALHYACGMKNLRTASILLRANADSSIVNLNKETPLDIATRLKFFKLVGILRKKS
uniref:Ankyrin repeat domain 22 n=1 Tax=Callorhinchus milii TaxID=7868 RepID=A0A4W3K3W8_CALMI